MLDEEEDGSVEKVQLDALQEILWALQNAALDSMEWVKDLWRVE